MTPVEKKVLRSALERESRRAIRTPGPTVAWSQRLLDQNERAVARELLNALDTGALDVSEGATA